MEEVLGALRAKPSAPVQRSQDIIQGPYPFNCSFDLLTRVS